MGNSTAAKLFAEAERVSRFTMPIEPFHMLYEGEAAPAHRNRRFRHDRAMARFDS